MKNGATVEERAGWIETELGQLCSKIVDGTHHTPEYTEKGIPFISVKDIHNGKVNFDNCKYISCETHNELIKRCFPEPDNLLITKSGTIGRMAIVPKKPDFSLFVSVALLKNYKSIINTKFLLYSLENYLNSINISQDIKGGLIKNFHLEDIRVTKVNLAPLPEQRAIVSKIEQLFSELDNGISNLKMAKEQLKVYRQAVLKKAFEGELTKKWREQKADLPDAGDLLEQIRKEREETAKKSSKKMKSINSLAESQLSNLPKGWGWTRLGNLVEEPKYGTSKKCDYNINGIGVLRIPNISDGLINDSDLKFAQFDSSEIENYCLKAEDILTIRSNGSVDLVGKCALVSVKDEKYLYAGYLIRLRPISSLINSKYLLNCLSSIDLRYQIESKAKSTSGVNNINSGELQSLIIPICSLPEQQAIVQEIETRLSVCDKIEQDIKESLEKAEVLRQSILKKAFEGKLLNKKELAEVRRAEDWEPGEVLLERVKAERARK
ncbi:restriction endonuclease [Methanosarcina sp. KYL-1]|uniref:restriction endonuclease subunit S n=1 Tax=Methanosarcina sp. KYL-1 TaxID=2602068 RepID=UPI002101604F|nr:restriction endonuclease subunit S [Methanosarcina sp. KYL-1]MCQ1534512.1 restriction endonuclease [Methanosarcina sp. KYL-1]